MKYLKPHMEILPQEQKLVWPHLAWVKSSGMVLYGGTAVALRLGHRFSVDFDFFTHRDLDHDRIFANLRSEGLLFKTTKEEPNTIYVETIPGEVKLSFFGGLTNGRVGIPSITPDKVLLVAAPQDLLGNKVKVILQRIKAKDYQDVEALVASGIKLEEGLSIARLLYGATFEPMASLKALTYFSGGDLEQLHTRTRDALRLAVETVKSIPSRSLESKELVTEQELVDVQLLGSYETSEQ